MKQVLVFEILRKLKSRPGFLRKVKIFAVLGLVGFVMVVGLAIWAVVSAVKYGVTTATQVVSSPTAEKQLDILKAELQDLQFQPLNCWGKAQSLLAVQPWLEKPAVDNLWNLKAACFESKPVVCEGHECSQMNKSLNKAEGGTT